jgi:hypothetical protein
MSAEGDLIQGLCLLTMSAEGDLIDIKRRNHQPFFKNKNKKTSSYN